MAFSPQSDFSAGANCHHGPAASMRVVSLFATRLLLCPWDMLTSHAWEGAHFKGKCAPSQFKGKSSQFKGNVLSTEMCMKSHDKTMPVLTFLPLVGNHVFLVPK